MELFQELVFTISFSLIVSLLIAKLFSMTSSCDDGNSTLPKSVEEKIEREWVVCDSEKEEKSSYFEDAVKVTEDIAFGYAEAELITEYVIDDPKSVGGGGESYVFDEIPNTTESKDDADYSVQSYESNAVDSVLATDLGSQIQLQEACVNSSESQQEPSSSLDESYVFDESPQRTESKQYTVNLQKIDDGNVVNSILACDMRSSIVEDCAKSSEPHQESSVTASESYVFDESPNIEKSKVDAVYLVKTDDANVVDPVSASGISISSPKQESIDVHLKSSAIDVGESKLEEKEGFFDDDWQGIETTDLEKQFGAAVAFLASKTISDRVNLIDNETKMQFYGLHRVAIEGPCFESQPMALKVSARANWNAWKRLGNLGREDAMEQYISLLSQHIPDWMGTHVIEEDMQ